MSGSQSRRGMSFLSPRSWFKTLRSVVRSVIPPPAVLRVKVPEERRNEWIGTPFRAGQFATRDVRPYRPLYAEDFEPYLTGPDAAKKRKCFKIWSDFERCVQMNGGNAAHCEVFLDLFEDCATRFLGYAGRHIGEKYEVRSPEDLVRMMVEHDIDEDVRRILSEEDASR